MWEGGRDRVIGLVDALGKQIDPKTMNFTDAGLHNDGVLEVEIVNTLMHMSLGKTNRIA